MKCFYCCALKETPRPFASTVGLAVVKGFNFPLEGLGLGVSLELIHCSNSVQMRFYCTSLYPRLQWCEKNAVLFRNFSLSFFFEIKLFRNRSVIQKKAGEQMQIFAH